MANNTSDRSGGDLGKLEGRLLSDRYRIVNLVAAGANTIVADAFDVEANQPVTVKIVRPDLVKIEGFAREFQRRAEVAMVMTHPNIATVLDWGETALDGEPMLYWVVEYLGGGSLRDVLDRGRLLQPSQALVVGLEACRALDAAHQRGLAHTELTPSKMIFGDDRRLRIVDFAMAELLGRTAWSEPATVATHVARYSSPEQALGVAVDAKTDIYSLALCLLEAVTGKLPFNAESTVATLAARIDRLLPVSADLGPLASVLERAGRPEPDDRTTAAEFGQALVQAAQKLPRPEPILIVAADHFDTSAMRRPTDPTGGIARPPEDAVGADQAAAPVVSPVVGSDADVAAVPGETVDVVAEPAAAHDLSADEQSSEHEPLIVLTDLADDPIDSGVATSSVDLADGFGAFDRAESLAGITSIDGAPTADPAGASGFGAALGGAASAAAVRAADTSAPFATSTMPAVTATMPAVSSAGFITSELYDDEPPRRRTAAIVALSLFIVLGLAASAFAGYLVLRTKTFEVPNLVGVDEAVALNEISGNGWEITVDRERSDDQPTVGAVIRTFPAAAAILEEGAEFRMLISLGPLFRLLPEIAEMDTPTAQATLEALQLSSFVEGDAFDEVLPVGSVISWTVRGDENMVAGEEVLPGTTIALIVSKGPAPRQVPQVVGLTFDQAVAAAAEVQLNVVAGPDVFSDDVPVGVIVLQDLPVGSELPRDGVFTVQLSKGLDLIAVPDLTGLSFTDAQTVLTDAGFTIGSLLGTTEGTFESIAINAEPIGDLYRRGTSVDLIFL